MKRGLSILLALVMVLSVFTVLPFTASAKEVDEEENGLNIELAKTGGLTLQQLKEKFPQGAYWNHKAQSGHYYVKTKHYGPCNNPDGYSWTPCYTHSGTAPVGQYDCNECDGAIQCAGFANKLAYDVYGSSFYSWSKGSIANAKPGDVLTYKASDTDQENGHTLMIIGVNGNTLTVGECNYGGNCKINWGRTINKNNISVVKLYVAPSQLPTNHTHNYNTYVYYWAAHPHYKCYKCSCGDVKENRNEPTYVSTCEICNPPAPGKPSFTEFELHNWSDGSFKQLNMAWTATSNTDRYEILFYNYSTGNCDKAIDCGSATLATLYYSDVPKGQYWVCIKSINQYDANWSESKYGEFVAPPTPTSGWIKSSKYVAIVGEEITFTFGGEGVTPVSNYWGTIKKDGAVVVNENWNYYTGTGRTLTFDTPGTYTAYVNVNHNSGSVNSPEITFFVYRPADLGEDFYAKVKNKKTGSYLSKDAYLTDRSFDVKALPKKDSFDQLWHFIRQDDGSYAIKNSANDWCLDVYGSYTENATNVQLYDTYNGTANQRFYLINIFDSYYIKPVYSDKMVDMNFGSGNLELWGFGENWDPQMFSIDKTEPFPGFEPVCLGADFKANITNSVEVKNIGVDGSGNVKAQTKNEKNEQKWRFEMQSDYSYKITNVKTGKCLAATADSVYTADDDGSNAQRFFFREHTFGFAIIAKTTGLALNISENNLTQTEFVENDDYYGKTFVFAIDGYFDIKPENTVTYNGHTYEYYKIMMPWNQAARFCEQKGGHLVTVTTAEESEFVCDLLDHNGGAWIGASDWHREGDWYWITGEKFDYQKWREGEPDNSAGREQFAILDTHPRGVWYDMPNAVSPKNSTINVVCEYDNGYVNTDSYQPSKIIETDGVKYGIFDYGVDWQTAEAICEAKGGHLVKIDSAEMNDTVAGIIAQGTKDYYWIDATDRFSEGVWTDAEGRELSYTNWSDHEPNNHFCIESNASIMTTNNKWADMKGLYCNLWSVGFICEYAPSPLTIKLHKDTVTLDQGKTYQLTATVTPAKADQTVTWRSSNTKVATVDDDGHVKAVDAGVTIIYAETENGLSAPCVITVQAVSKQLLGDVDGDEQITIFDASLIQKYIAGSTSAELAEKIADVDNDEHITIFDASLIQRHIAGNKTGYRIGETV